MAVTWGFDIDTYLRAHPGVAPVFGVEIVAWSTSAGAYVTHYFFSGRYTVGPAHDLYGSNIHYGLVTKGLTYQSAAVSSVTQAFGLADEPRAGSFSIAGRPGEVDWIVRSGIVWEGASVTLAALVDNVCNWNDAPKLFVQTVKSARQTAPGQVLFELKDRGEYLKAPVQNRVFSGSDWNLRLAGGSGWVDLGTPSALQLTGTSPFTVVARFRAKSAWVTRGLIGWGTESTANAFPWHIRLENTGAIRYQTNLGAGVVSVVTTSILLSVDVPYVVAVAVGGGTCRVTAVNLFTAEVEEEELTLSTSALNRAAPHASHHLSIGRHNAILGGVDLVVDWAGVFRWSQPRSWVEELARRQLTAAEAAKAQCLGFWRFEEGTGTSIGDSSGTGATGTVTGTGTWAWSLEGGEQLEGQLKPSRFGAIERCEPVQVRAIPRIWCIDGWKWNSVTDVTEGGASLGAAGTVYTDPETFSAGGTPTTWDVLRWNGGTFLRLSANPTLPLAVKGQGAVNHLDAYVNTCDGIVLAICRRILASEPGHIQEMADPFETNTSDVLQFDAREAASAEEAIAFLARSVGAGAFIDRQGYLRGKLLRQAGSQAMDAFIGTDAIKDVKSLTPGAPVSRLLLYWLLNGAELDQSDVAAGILNTAAEFYATSPGKKYSAFAHPRVGRLDSELEWRTGLTTRASAEEVGQRVVQVLGGRDPKSFEIVADLGAARFEPFDHVAIRYTTPMAGAGRMPAFGLGEGGAEDTGGCLIWDGGNIVGHIGNNISPLEVDEFTVEAWFYCDGDPADVGAGGRCLIAFEELGGDKRVRAIVAPENHATAIDGALVWQWTEAAGSNVVELSTPFSVMDRRWHHVAFVRDATDHAIWVDGIKVAAASRCGSLPAAIVSNSFTIGDTSTGASGPSDLPWLGSIRDVRLWTEARSGDEIWNQRFSVAGERFLDQGGQLALWVPADRAVPVSGNQLLRTGHFISWAGAPDFAMRDQQLPYGWGYTPFVILSVTDEIGDDLGRVRMVLFADH